MKKNLRTVCFLLVLAGLFLLAGCPDSVPEEDPQLNLPAAPTGLTATAGDRFVNLAWTNPADTAGITEAEVAVSYSSTTVDVNLPFTGGALPASAKISSLNGTALVNGTAYTFKVRLKNSDGWGAYSNEDTATPQNATNPPAQAPANVGFDLNQMGEGELYVKWDEVADASGYYLKYGTADDKNVAEWWPDEEEEIADTYALIEELDTNTVYYVWVQAVNSAGPGPWTASASELTKPGKPSITVSAGSELGEIEVEWTAADTADIAVKYGTLDDIAEADDWEDDIEAGGTTITGLNANTLYYVWVYAVNDSGQSDVATGSATTLQVPVPGIPQTVRTTAAGGMVTVTWDTPANHQYVVEFEIAYRLSSAPSYIETDIVSIQDEPGATSANVTGLNNGTEYKFKVRARSAGGWSDFSDEATGIPAAATAAPSAPTVSFDTSGEYPLDGQLYVSWTVPVEGAQHYTVKHNTSDSDTGATELANISTLYYHFTGLTGGETYFVWVKAWNDFGGLADGPWSTVVSAIAPKKADPPEFSVATGTELGDIEITWTRAAANPAANQAAVTANEVKYGTVDDIEDAGTQSWTTNVDADGTTISGLANATRYYVWVRAQNTAGWSDWSAENAATAIQTPAAVVLSDNTVAGGLLAEGELVATWVENIDNATTYTLSHSISTDADAGTIITSATSPQTITGLTPGATYNVWVRAETPVGSSDWSPSDSRATPKKPDAPTFAFNQPAAGRGELVLTWTLAAGVDSHQVKYGIVDNVEDSGTQNWTTNVGDNGTTITGLNDGTQYYVWVQATNAAGDSGWANSSRTTKYMYTVTFNYVSSGEFTTREVLEGDTVAAPSPAPTWIETERTITAAGLYPPGTFNRWNNGASAYNFSTAVNGNLTLTANWSNTARINSITQNLSGDWWSIFAHIRDNPQPQAYTLVLSQNVTKNGDGGQDIFGNLTIRSLDNTQRTITLATNGKMFFLYDGNYTLTIDNISLVGKTANNNNMVRVRNGTFIMQNNSKISGNFNSHDEYWEDMFTVVVSEGGNLIMRDSEISGNTCTAGWGDSGGVYTHVGRDNAKITIHNGIIRNNISSDGGVEKNLRYANAAEGGLTISGNTQIPAATLHYPDGWGHGLNAATILIPSAFTGNVTFTNIDFSGGAFTTFAQSTNGYTLVDADKNNFTVPSNRTLTLTGNTPGNTLRYP